MTDLGTVPVSSPGSTARGAAVPLSPPAVRLQPPRWRDGRLLAGVLLLLVSVAVGARVLAVGETTTPVVSLARDLPVGHVLAPGDLATTQVRLASGSASAYLPGSALDGLAGRVLTRGGGRGELLAATGVGPPTTAAARLVPLRVRDGHTPDLAAGDHVDVYGTAVLRPPGGVEACTTQLVVSDVEVGVDAPRPEGGGDLTLLLHVTPEQAPALVHAAQTTALDVVRHLPAGDVQGAAPPGPVAGLGGAATTACGSGR